MKSTSLALGVFVTYLLFLLAPAPAAGAMCYSCAGNCHREPCNCQMGSCEADHCFIERKPSTTAGLVRIVKGCLKRPTRSHLGCDYDNTADNIHCVCSGEFCNDVVHLRPASRRNVTCHECTDRDPNCGDTCVGHWCHEDSITGVTGCGYGPPSLPFFYKGPELLFHRSKICVTMSRPGSGKPRRHCICNTPLCNDFSRQAHSIGLFGAENTRLRYSNTRSESGHKSRSLVAYNYASHNLPFHTCVSCDTTAQDSAVTSACKQHFCVGHFCTLTTRRIIVTGLSSRIGTHAILNEQQGCMNVTDSYRIQLGCSHKWMNDEHEELFCACVGDECNKDLTTASLSSSPPPLLSLVPSSPVILSIFACLLLNQIQRF